MNDRIKELIVRLGIKKAEFARRLNLSQSFVSELCSGKNKPSDRTIADICREFKVSEVWLRTGSGQPFVAVDEDSEFIKICKEINISDDTLIKCVIKAYWRMGEEEKAVLRKYAHVYVNILSGSSAQR